MVNIRLAALCATALATNAGPAGAQEAESDGTEILVTAQRRPEAIAKTPIAIAAFDGDFIASARLDDIKDVTVYAPGFAGNSDDSYIEDIAVRGIVSNDYGIGGEPSIGLFKDGIHQGRTGSAVTSLYDIERAEALRGPQGFLFGRNAISGAISVVTRKPDLGATSGHFDLTVGEPNRYEVEAALNLPLGDSWALRVAGYGLRTDGWVDNAFTPERDRIMRQDKTAARVSLLHEADGWRFVLTGEHERRRLDGTPYRASNADREVLDYLDAALGTRIVIGGGPRSVDTELVSPRDDGDISSVTATVERDLGFASISAIAGYRGHRFYYEEDYDATPLPLGVYRQRQSGTYASGELRLVSPGTGPLTWSTGVSAYREKVKARYWDEADETYVCLAGYGYASCDDMTQDLFGTAYAPAANGMLVQVNDAVNTTVGISAYGDLNYLLLPRLQLGAGLRYSRDRKRFALDVPRAATSLGNVWTFPYFTKGFIEDTRTWAGFTPRFYARWEPGANLSIYASLTRGHKAGGYGSFTVDASSPIPDYGLVPAGTRPDAFEPETVWSKELGIKGNVWGRRLRFDVTGFHYVYTDLQTNYYDTATRTQQVINIGKVHGTGVESAITFHPSPWFDLRGTLTWTRTVTSGDRGCPLADCGGLPNPTWQSSGIATFHYPMGRNEAWLSGEWTWVGSIREPWDWRGIVHRDPYAVANLVAGYRAGDRWEASVYVQNLFDKVYYQGALNGGDLDPASLWGVSQPRNIGINVRYKFGG